jgi:hypothetical protein
MTIDESALAGLPLKVRRLVLRAIAEAAAYGVPLQVATVETRRQVSTRERVRRHRERQRGGVTSVTGNALQALQNVTSESVTSVTTQGPESTENPAKGPISSDSSSVTRLAGARAPALSLISSSSSLSGSSSSLLALSGSGSEISDAGARVASPVPRAKREPKLKALTWRRVPESWQPSPEHRQIARDLRIPFDLELAKFRDHEFTVPKRDPDATFRNWIRNAKPSAALPPPPTNGHKHATMADIDRLMGLA